MMSGVTLAGEGDASATSLRCTSVLLSITGRCRKTLAKILLRLRFFFDGTMLSLGTLRGGGRRDTTVL